MEGGYDYYRFTQDILWVFCKLVPRGATNKPTTMPPTTKIEPTEKKKILPHIFHFNSETMSNSTTSNSSPSINNETSSSKDVAAGVPSGFVLKLYQMVTGAPDDVISVSSKPAIRHISRRSILYFSYSKENMYRTFMRDPLAFLAKMRLGIRNLPMFFEISSQRKTHTKTFCNNMNTM